MAYNMQNAYSFYTTDPITGQMYRVDREIYTPVHTNYSQQSNPPLQSNHRSHNYNHHRSCYECGHGYAHVVGCNGVNCNCCPICCNLRAHSRPHVPHVQHHYNHNNSSYPYDGSRPRPHVQHHNNHTNSSHPYNGSGSTRSRTTCTNHMAPQIPQLSPAELMNQVMGLRDAGWRNHSAL
jgi:hypothetical protein